MRPKENYLMWNMTRKCNFRCSYCYYPHDHSPVDTVLPVDKILDFLRSTGQPWMVGMTGGEPFLYPNFVELCQALTKEHRIGVDSNLSASPRIRRFAETIDPTRVHDIYASLHIEERERLNLKEDFAANVRLLLERGFKVKVNYVLHPDLLDRYEADVAWFGERGVALTPRPFKGKHEGKRYPQAYGKRVKSLFEGHPSAGKKMVFNFKGIPCEGGRSFLRMEGDGTILRCAGDKSVLGNILEDVKINVELEPCQVKRCPCQGANWVSLNETQQAMVEGLQFHVIGDLQRSKTAFEKVLALDPLSSNALNNLSVLAWLEGDAEAAADFIAKAIDIHPENIFYAANVTALQANEEPKICRDVIASAE